MGFKGGLSLQQGLQDPHAKVRWAACQALGQMCTDLGPELQIAKHQIVVPGLMGVMDDFSQPRVQAHAAAAIVNFSENCEQVHLGHLRLSRLLHFGTLPPVKHQPCFFCLLASLLEFLGWFVFL
jgi:hypothetical protein